MKTCSRCLAEKPEEAFYLDKRRGTRRTRCIECCKANPSPNSGKRTPEQRAAYKRRRGEVTCEYVPQFERLLRAAQKRAARDDERQRKRAEREARGRKPNLGTKDWYMTATPEQIASYLKKMKEKYRRRYLANPDAERERAKAYKHAIPQAVAKWGDRRKRLATERADGTLTHAETQRLFREATHCPYCGTRMARRQKTVDHIIPLSRGGAHGLINVVICCGQCNTKKNAKPFDEWIAELDDKNASGALKLYMARYGVDPRQAGLALPFAELP